MGLSGRRGRRVLGGVVRRLIMRDKGGAGRTRKARKGLKKTARGSQRQVCLEVPFPGILGNSIYFIKHKWHHN